MKRFVAFFVVVLIGGASARLLVCDYACFDHARPAESSRPVCHEPKHEESSAALTAGQDDCDEQPLLVAGFLAGKITSLAKPPVLALHTVGFCALSIDIARGAPPRMSLGFTFTASHITPLRI
jgi:hypothetical protein